MLLTFSPSTGLTRMPTQRYRDRCHQPGGSWGGSQQVPLLKSLSWVNNDPPAHKPGMGLHVTGVKSKCTEDRGPSFAGRSCLCPVAWPGGVLLPSPAPVCPMP